MGNEAAQQERERPWDGVLRREIDVEFRSINEDERSFEVVASSETLDSHGDVLKQFWDLSRYQKNPVVLWNHNLGAMWGSGDAEEALPIGKAADVRLEGKKLVAKLFLLKGDAASEPFVDKLWRRVQQGVLKAVSVGFRAGQVTRITNPAGETLHYELGSKERPNELREISIVPMGSNPDAVAKTIEWERKHLTVDATEQRADAGESQAAEAQKSEPETQPAPSSAADVTSPTPAEVAEEPKDMPISKALAAALNVAEDADEATVVAAVNALKSLPQVNAAAVNVALEIERIVGAVGPEAIGAVRALKADQEQLVEARAELSRTKSALSRNAFDVAVASGRSAKKLTPHAIKDFTKRFDEALAKGESGEEIVAELQGFIRLAAPFAVEAKQGSTSTEGTLTYNGKTYAQMSYSERDKLSKADPELWRSMKTDHEQAQA